MTMNPVEEIEKRREGTWRTDDLRPPTKGYTWLLDGDGLPTKIALGSQDASPSLLLELANRPLTDSACYDTATRVVQGMILLAVNPVSWGDQAWNAQAGFISGYGKATDDVLDFKRSEEANPSDEPTVAWRVIGERGRSCVLVLPANETSGAELVEMLSDHMRGEFHIERLDGGMLTVAENPVVPGWNLVVGPPVHLTAEVGFRL